DDAHRGARAGADAVLPRAEPALAAAAHPRARRAVPGAGPAGRPAARRDGPDDVRPRHPARPDLAAAPGRRALDPQPGHADDGVRQAQGRGVGAAGAGDHRGDHRRLALHGGDRRRAQPDRGGQGRRRGLRHRSAAQVQRRGRLLRRHRHDAGAPDPGPGRGDRGHQGAAAAALDRDRRGHLHLAGGPGPGPARPRRPRRRGAGPDRAAQRRQDAGGPVLRRGREGRGGPGRAGLHDRLRHGRRLHRGERPARARAGRPVRAGTGLPGVRRRGLHGDVGRPAQGGLRGHRQLGRDREGRPGGHRALRGVRPGFRDPRRPRDDLVGCSLAL
ncbi:MAG: Aerotolerance protein BatA, partial [uncultured Friedmanniella sp.]